MRAITFRSARTGRTATASVALAAGLVAGPAVAAALQDAKYSAPINITTGKVTLQATATFSDGSSADRLYRVTGDADSDGDSIPDEYWLRVACSGGAVTGAQAYSLSGHTPVRPRAENTAKSPRDSASGMATGKRQHKPFTVIKEWDRSAASGKIVNWEWDLNREGKPLLATWNIKNDNGKRTGKAAPADWHKVKLNPGAAELCD